MLKDKNNNGVPAEGENPETGAADKKRKPTREEKKALKLKKKAAKKKRNGKLAPLKVLSVIIIVLIVLASLLMYYKTPILVYFGLIEDPTLVETRALSVKQQKLTLKEGLFDDFDTELVFGESNSVNILLFGLDENEAREDTYTIFRPDTIMVASLNIETKSIKLISIPRDSFVTIYGHVYSGSGKDKINSCFAYGSYEHEPEEYFEYGVKCLKETVSRLCGITINYYMGVDMDGAEDVINALGGVSFNVPSAVTNKGKVLVPEGQQVLNGYNFMQVARCRDYAMGDIGRVSVQQDLLRALFSEVKKANNIMKLPKLVSIAFDMLRTDITFDAATSLAFMMMEDFSPDNIKTGTFPGNFGNRYGLSYWIINQSARVDFCYDMFGVTVTRLSQDERYIK